MIQLKNYTTQMKNYENYAEQKWKLYNANVKL